MNKTEAAYAAHLLSRQFAGEIAWFQFEAIKLRLADATFYTPDFFVMLADDSLEVREVKGHWEDDARVKIKVAAEHFPFRFVAVTAIPKRDGGGWATEIFERAEPHAKVPIPGHGEAQGEPKPPRVSGKTPMPIVDPVAAISGRQWLMDGNPMTPAQIATAKRQLGMN